MAIGKGGCRVIDLGQGGQAARERADGARGKRQQKSMVADPNDTDSERAFRGPGFKAVASAANSARGASAESAQKAA